MALRLEPADWPGAALKLQLIGAGPAADAPPSAFVETLFDQYAEKFDDALVKTLGYCGPELIVEAIQAAVPGRGFRHAVDLGCGTGLMGERLRPFVGYLEGHDISAAMLRKAEARKVYDRLVRSDLQQLALEARGADLITAADVFIYVGALERVVATVGSTLSPGGLFAFSVERHDGPEDFILRETRRYAHSEDYVRRLLSQTDLAVTSLDVDTIRKDRNWPVTALIIVACRK